MDHIRANQPLYLGAVFSMVREWIRLGRPRTDERRHDFRDWAQVLDYLVQHILEEAPLMDALLSPLQCSPSQPLRITLAGASEVLSLEWARVNRERCLVHLEAGQTKNDEGRVFPYGDLPELREMIEAQWTETKRVEKERSIICP